MFNRFFKRLSFLFIRIILPFTLKSLFSLLPRRKKTLLLIKNDGIGDYVLFRNFLQFLANSEKYKGFRISLLANSSSKEMAHHFDRSSVDRFYWYSDGFFLKWNLVSLLWQLHRLRPETIAYASYSRNFQTDWIVGKLAASYKIAFHGDTVNQTPAMKSVSDLYYNRLIDDEQKNLHEFDRNKQFFIALTGEDCQLIRPVLDRNYLHISNHQRPVIFIGGSTAAKRWPVDKHSALCKLLLEGQSGSIIIAGGPDERSAAEEIVTIAASDRVVSCAGELTLITLCELIAGASVLVSNDTVAVHMAVALGIPVVCLSKGDLFGRFVPYPETIFDQFETVLPYAYSVNHCSYGGSSPYSIEDIEVSSVYIAIKKIIRNCESINESA